MSERILVVDDDPIQRRLLEAMVARAGYQAVAAEGGVAAAAILTGTNGARIDAVVLDLAMPGLDGLGVLARMRESGLATPVIVQTAHGASDNVAAAMRAGATDFVVKPVGAERLQVSLRNALAVSALTGELNRIKHGRSGTLTFRDIITRSARMAAVIRTAEKASISTIPVLIEGQPGVGKELIARAIHGTGERRAKPFVAVNCSAIPDNLIELILFGHEKGAPGATDRHTGKIADANGGTLFLAEVSELPLAAQVKLLRAIQENEVEPIGARKPVSVDVRVICASTRNLFACLRDGRFREDLFYRLHVFSISVPPLAERAEDIPELVRHFLARFAAEAGKRIARVNEEALALLLAYHWPGNVRQLENAVFRAVALAEHDEIGVAEFPQIEHAARVMTPPTAPLDPTNGLTGVTAPALTGDPGAEIGMITPYPSPALALVDAVGEVRPLEDIETEVIRFAIAHYRGHMAEVARRLKIGRSTLYRKLDSIGAADGAAAVGSQAAVSR